jgi:DNA-binding protein H-NS
LFLSKYWNPKMDFKRLNEMSIDELWVLHEHISAELSHKLIAEKAVLDERLGKLALNKSDLTGERRPHPKVAPKYRNPQNVKETWSGRGKTPRWLAAQLKAGRNLDYFLIDDPRS